MNKALVFPLIIMFIVSLVLFASASIAPQTTTGEYSESSGIVVDGSYEEIQIVDESSVTLDVWSVAGFMVLVVAAIAIGITAGVGVLGSGLSDSAQRIIIISIIYMGLWACLTVITATMLWETTIGTVTWLGLTIIFLLGVSSELTESD